MTGFLPEIFFLAGFLLAGFLLTLTLLRILLADLAFFLCMAVFFFFAITLSFLFTFLNDTGRAFFFAVFFAPFFAFLAGFFTPFFAAFLTGFLFMVPPRKNF
ncbi:MAG: hypothetical protein EHM28_01385 [Spirochaetaceae bacterium]|nr:MAG: hypothetical protein EHM28_01385 [Spirochaetaceae bacterium]